MTKKKHNINKGYVPLAPGVKIRSFTPINNFFSNL